MPQAHTLILKSEEDLGRLYDTLEAELTHGELDVTWEPYKPQRSILQNRLYWEYLTQIGKAIGHTKNELHLYYRNEFLGPEIKEIMGKVFYELPSTQDLNTKEFSEYITNIEIHAAEQGITLFAPPYREDAMR